MAEGDWSVPVGVSVTPVEIEVERVLVMIGAVPGGWRAMAG